MQHKNNKTSDIFCVSVCIPYLQHRTHLPQLSCTKFDGSYTRIGMIDWGVLLGRFFAARNQTFSMFFPRMATISINGIV